MELSTAIQKNRLMDVNLLTKYDLIYSGVCLKASKKIWVIVNYNHRLKVHDGYTIINNYEIESFSIWKKKYVILKKNNFNEFSKSFPLKKINTFYSCLKYLSKSTIFSIYTKEDSKSYYVGRVVKLERDNLIMQLVNVDAKWSSQVKILLSNVLLISFHTSYERKLAKKLYK
jgi:hypothetical protein